MTVAGHRGFDAVHPLHLRGALYGFAPAREGASPRDIATVVFPELADWWGIIDAANIPEDAAIGIAAVSQRNGTSFAAKRLPAASSPNKSSSRPSPGHWA